MKHYLFYLILASSPLIGQVNTGINTISPTETLDVNGNTRVRNLPTNAGTTNDKVVVTDSNGVLKSIPEDSFIQTEVDGVIGNEVVDATPNQGLERKGLGTASNPYTIGLTTSNSPLTMLVGSDGEWSRKSINMLDITVVYSEGLIIDYYNIDCNTMSWRVSYLNGPLGYWHCAKLSNNAGKRWVYHGYYFKNNNITYGTLHLGPTQNPSYFPRLMNDYDETPRELENASNTVYTVSINGNTIVVPKGVRTATLHVGN